MTNEEFRRLERDLFIEKLGLGEEQVREAANNLIGAFMALYDINERLKKEGNPAAV